jgi:hypothetical protein
MCLMKSIRDAKMKSECYSNQITVKVSGYSSGGYHPATKLTTDSLFALTSGASMHMPLASIPTLQNDTAKLSDTYAKSIVSLM